MRLRIETLILEIHPDHSWLIILVAIGIGVMIGAWLMRQGTHEEYKESPTSTRRHQRRK